MPTVWKVGKKVLPQPFHSVSRHRAMSLPEAMTDEIEYRSLRRFAMSNGVLISNYFDMPSIAFGAKR